MNVYSCPCHIKAANLIRIEKENLGSSKAVFQMQHGEEEDIYQLAPTKPIYLEQ